MIASKDNIVLVVGFMSRYRVIIFQSKEAAKAYVTGSGLERVKYSKIIQDYKKEMAIENKLSVMHK